MKSLIVLRGITAQGKSSTLNHLIALISENIHYTTVTSDIHPDGYDRTYIASGPFGKIGIITFGDPGAEDHVAGLLDEMKRIDVHIIFAASRTRGRVLEILYNFASINKYEIISTSPLHYESKNDITLINTLNKIEASMLFSLIQQLSDGK